MKPAKVTSIVWFVLRAMIFYRVHCLALKPLCLDFLGMQEAMDSILCLPSAPFDLITLRGLASYFQESAGGP
jgi:hypothetical protein